MTVPFLTGYVLGQHGVQSARIASTISARADSPVEELLDLHERVDRLILVVDAMWALLKESGYTDEQLVERISHIDAADGELDGRKTATIGQCNQCGAKVAKGLNACQFCGTGLDADINDPLGAI